MNTGNYIHYCHDHRTISKALEAHNCGVFASFSICLLRFVDSKTHCKLYTSNVVCDKFGNSHWFFGPIEKNTKHRAFQPININPILWHTITKIRATSTFSSNIFVQYLVYLLFAEFYFVEALSKTVYSLSNSFYDLFCISLSPQILSPIQIFVCTWFRCDFSKCFLYFSVVSHSQTSSEFFVCVFFWFRLVANLMFNYYEVCVLRFFF